MRDVNSLLLIDYKHDSGSELGVAQRINSVRSTFDALSNIWKCSYFDTRMELRPFYTFILSVLLYGKGIWKVTTSVTQKLQTFVCDVLLDYTGLVGAKAHTGKTTLAKDK